MKLGQCLAMHLLFLWDSAQEKLRNYMIKKRKKGCGLDLYWSSGRRTSTVFSLVVCISQYMTQWKHFHPHLCLVQERHLAEFGTILEKAAREIQRVIPQCGDNMFQNIFLVLLVS